MVDVQPINIEMLNKRQARFLVLHRDDKSPAGASRFCKETVGTIAYGLPNRAALTRSYKANANGRKISASHREMSSPNALPKPKRFLSFYKNGMLPSCI